MSISTTGTYKENVFVKKYIHFLLVEQQVQPSNLRLIKVSFIKVDNLEGPLARGYFERGQDQSSYRCGERDKWDVSTDQTNSEVLGMGVLMETGQIRDQIRDMAMLAQI